MQNQTDEVKIENQAVLIENQAVLIESRIYCDICGYEIAQERVMTARGNYYCRACEEDAINTKGIIPRWVKLRRWNVK